jgi:transposase
VGRQRGKTDPIDAENAARAVLAGTATPKRAGDNPERIRSEAAFAKLCGACPIPASLGKTRRYRLNRGGHRANAALYRVVIVRMRFHQPTIDYVARRTAEGQVQGRDHPLKRFLAREIYHLISPPEDQATPGAA